jgi:hypothetical protein
VPCNSRDGKCGGGTETPGGKWLSRPNCEQIARKKGCINYGIAVKYVS